MQVAKILLIFYILLASNYTPDLMGKQLKTFLSENRIAQHFMAYMTMLVLVMLVGDVTDLYTAFTYSAVGYLWFIFTTKMDIQWNIIIMLSLLIIFMYESNIENKEKELSKDPNIDKNSMDNIQVTSRYIQKILLCGVVGCTCIGMFMYISKKGNQYGGGNFDPITFLLY